MNEDLDELIRAGEGITLEFTASGEPERIGEAVCAFLNARGGHVVAGVSDSGKVVGLNDPPQLARNLTEYLRSNLSPPAALAILPQTASKKAVLLVDVPRGTAKPYVLGGRILIRSGSTNKVARADDLHRLIEERAETETTWERQPAVGLTAADTDATEVSHTVEQAVRVGRLSPVDPNRLTALEALRVINDGRLLQVGAVAFAEHVLPWYPQCTLRLARFRGTTKNEFLDERRVTGHAFRLLDEALGFLNRHVPVEGTFIPGNPVRQDRPLYPQLALREAIVNALCHRNYAIPGGAISIAMFDDRLEIASTGTLPAGLTTSDLTRDHLSLPRNPLLADVLYRRGLIELWGRGTQTIVRLCHEGGLPDPEYTERAGEFVVRFFSRTFTPPSHLEPDLPERQRRILVALGERAETSIRDIHRLVAPRLSVGAIRNDLNALRERGLVESIGAGRGAAWRMVGTRNLKRTESRRMHTSAQ